MVAIMAPLEINPQIIMWDPDTYPDDRDDRRRRRRTDVTINIFGGLRLRRRVRRPGHLVRRTRSTRRTTARRRGSSSRSTSPSRASPRPSRTTTSSSSRSTARRPAYQLLNDAGYPTYSQTLSVLPEDVEGDGGRAGRSSSRSPSRRRSTSSTTPPGRTRSSSTPSSRSTRSGCTAPGLAEYSVQTQLELGLVGNGPDDTLGNFDEARVAGDARHHARRRRRRARRPDRRRDVHQPVHRRQHRPLS